MVGFLLTVEREKIKLFSVAKLWILIVVEYKIDKWTFIHNSSKLLKMREKVEKRTKLLSKTIKYVEEKINAQNWRTCSFYNKYASAVLSKCERSSSCIFQEYTKESQKNFKKLNNAIWFHKRRKIGLCRIRPGLIYKYHHKTIVFLIFRQNYKTVL